MALSTYDELKASIADFLNRDDLTTVITNSVIKLNGTNILDKECLSENDEDFSR